MFSSAPSVRRARREPPWLAILACLAACADDPQSKSCRPGEVVCVQDGTLHAVVPQGCQHSGQCPSGLRCGASESPNQCPATRCRPYPEDATYATNALIDGFEVPSFLLSPTQQANGTQAFTWMPVRDATAVACALFGCPPELGASPAGADGEPGNRIVNFEQCVLAWEMYPGEGLFDLASLAPYEPQSSQCEGSVEEQPHQVSTLLVGCWAFGGHEVVAATKLMEVRPDSVAARVLDETTDACASEDDGRSCLRQQEPQVFGTCLGGVCRARCIGAIDCEKLAPDPISGTSDSSTTTGATTGTTGHEELEPGLCCRNWPHLGVCVTEAERSEVTCAEVGK